VAYALRDLWTPIAAAADPQWTIYVGPPSGGEVPARYMAVAYGGGLPGAERPFAVGGRVPSELGNPGQVSAEKYAMWNACTSATGEEDAQLVFDATDAMFQQMAEAVSGNRKLGGVLGGPGVADIGLYEWQLGDGKATVFFQVLVDAGWVQ
jgi:hypothetical protein